jgi:tetratricopeptide (TPR) repeat protein
VAVVVGVSVAVWQAQVARAEQRRADEVKAFIASIFAGADPYSGGRRDTTALDLLARARGRVDATALEPESRVELLAIIGQSLLMLQDTDNAEAAVRQAVDEGRRNLGAHHARTLDARLLFVDVHRFRGRTGEMAAELDDLIPAFRRLGREGEKDLATALEYRSHMALDAGRYPEAEAAAREALELGEVVLGPTHPKTVQLAMMLAQTLQYLGGVLSQGQTHLIARQLPEAMATLEQAEAGLTRSMGTNHQPVVVARHHLWQARAWHGRADEAREALTALLATYQPADQALLAPIWYSLGVAERLRGDHAAGLAAQQRALTLFGDGPAAALDRAHVQTEMGLDLLGVRRVEEARAGLLDVVNGFATIQVAMTPQHADADRDLVWLPLRSGAHGCGVAALGGWPRPPTPRANVVPTRLLGGDLPAAGQTPARKDVDRAASGTRARQAWEGRFHVRQPQRWRVLDEEDGAAAANRRDALPR